MQQTKILHAYLPYQKTEVLIFMKCHLYGIDLLNVIGILNVTHENKKKQIVIIFNVFHNL